MVCLTITTLETEILGFGVQSLESFHDPFGTGGSRTLYGSPRHSYISRGIVGVGVSSLCPNLVLTPLSKNAFFLAPLLSPHFECTLGPLDVHIGSASNPSGVSFISRTVWTFPSPLLFSSLPGSLFCCPRGWSEFGHIGMLHSKLLQTIPFPIFAVLGDGKVPGILLWGPIWVFHLRFWDSEVLIGWGDGRSVSGEFSGTGGLFLPTPSVLNRMLKLSSLVLPAPTWSCTPSWSCDCDFGITLNWDVSVISLPGVKAYSSRKSTLFLAFLIIRSLECL